MWRFYKFININKLWFTSRENSSPIVSILSQRNLGSVSYKKISPKKTCMSLKVRPSSVRKSSEIYVTLNSISSPNPWDNTSWIWLNQRPKFHNHPENSWSPCSRQESPLIEVYLINKKFEMPLRKKKRTFLPFAQRAWSQHKYLKG